MHDAVTALQGPGNGLCIADVALVKVHTRRQFRLHIAMNLFYQGIQYANSITISTSSAATCRPINPDPPVTRMVSDTENHLKVRVVDAHPNRTLW